MSETPNELQLIRSFVAVAQESSFTRAAARLGIGKGTVSRHVASLEAKLKVELVHRNTHHVALSTAGAALYERTQGPLLALQQALEQMPERDEEPSGLLRIAAPIDFGTAVLLPAITSFSRRFPGVSFDVRLNNEYVDLVKYGYDFAVRVATGPLKDSTLTMRKLAQPRAGVYASPEYLKGRGRPRIVGEEDHAWVMHPAVTRMLDVRPEAVRFVVSDFLVARDLIRLGAGVGVLPDFLTASDVGDGILEEVHVADLPQLAGDLLLLYPSSGTVSRKVMAFRDFLLRTLNS